MKQKVCNRKKQFTFYLEKIAWKIFGNDVPKLEIPQNQ